MRYCQRCVMPDTKPGVILDKRGLCNACRSVEKKKKINWKEREKKLKKIAKNIKKDQHPFYDCLVPVSGGKNSWYQALIASQKLKLKTLCVVLAAHLPTYEGIYNLNTMIKDLNIDLIKINLKPSVYRKIRKKNFLVQGEPNWAEHNCVFSGIANIATLYDIPLILWGEDINFEFGGAQKNSNSVPNALTINKGDLIGNKSIKDWLDKDIKKKDMFFYEYPKSKLFKEKNIKGTYLGYYEWWEGRKHYETVKKRGFIPRIQGPLTGNYISYDNIDEKLCEIGIWLKYIKFGFWRPTDQTCYDIWNNKLTRNQAVKIVNSLQEKFPEEYFQDFLRFHQITKKTFWNTVEKFRNKKIWKKNNNKWLIKYPLKKII